MLAEPFQEGQTSAAAGSGGPYLNFVLAQFYLERRRSRDLCVSISSHLCLAGKGESPVDIWTPIYAIATIYLMYRQNQILERQNQIMLSQGGKPKADNAKPLLPVLARVGRYWPMLTMLVLAVTTWLPHFIPSLPQTFQSKEKGQLTVTVSSVIPGRVALQELDNKTFEDADVPLDGYFFKNCSFINCCLTYEGGGYILENATFKKHWHICVRDGSDLGNYASLLTALNIAPAQAGRTIVPPRK